MSQISNLQKQVALHTARAMSVEKPPIARYWDDEKKSDIYILEAQDRPQRGVTSYATVGLSEHPLVKDGKEFGARVELVGACSSAVKEFANVMATISFCIINSKWFCAPGIIFPGVVDMYGFSGTMSDIYFASPFLWSGLEASITIEDKRVAWLLAMPISKSETEFARRMGSAALEEAFMKNDIDIFDPSRPAVA